MRALVVIVKTMATKKTPKNKGGRPPKYETNEQVWEQADKYFKMCDKTRQLPEKAGLCMFLGITRETYNQYKNVKFPDTIKYCDLYIESSWVRRLGGAQATGAIFYLKNAFKDDFKDRHAIGGDEDNPLTVGVVMLPQRENSLATNGETK